MSGYVRIHRSLFEDHPAFRNGAEAMAFAWLIVKAAWKPTRVRYKERTISLERGQVAVSVRDMARAMDRDKAWVERLLKRLKSETMIVARHETGVNVITICNYNEYQADVGPPETPNETPDETPDETGARQGRDTEQRREEYKKDNKPIGARAIPDWLPVEEWRGFVEMRRKIKKPLTERALAMAIRKLAELRGDGEDPAAVLDQSTLHCWQDLYPIRPEARPQPAIPL